MQFNDVQHVLVVDERFGKPTGDHPVMIRTRTGPVRIDFVLERIVNQCDQSKLSTQRGVAEEAIDIREHGLEMRTN